MELASPHTLDEQTESIIVPEPSDSLVAAPSARSASSYVMTDKGPDEVDEVPLLVKVSSLKTLEASSVTADDVFVSLVKPPSSLGRNEPGGKAESTKQVSEGAKKESHHERAFGAEFWVLNLMVALCYAGCPTFILFASQFFQEVYSDSFQQANLDSSMIENFVIIMGPLGGAFIDRFGCRSVMLLIGIIIINVGNIFVIIAEEVSIPAFAIGCILGFGWSAVYVSAWSLVPVTVKNPKSLGLGAGITGCSQNIGLLIGTTVVGLIEDWDHSVRRSAVTQYFLSVGVMVLLVNLYFIAVIEKA